MTKNKIVKPEHEANLALAGELAGLLDEASVHEWFAKSAQKVINKELSARGWNATVELAGVSVAFRSTWGAYVVRAYALQLAKGGRDFPVKTLFTTAQDAARLPRFKDDKNGAKFAKALKEVGTDFPKFRAMVKAEAEQVKKTRGANKKTANEKDMDTPKDMDIPVAMTIDEVVALTLATLEALSDDNRQISDFESAEKLGRVLKSAIANSRAVASAHPVKSKKVKANA